MNMKNRDHRTIAVTHDPEMMDIVINHVSNGGSLIDLCKTWQVRYSDVMRAIRSNPSYFERYEAALVDRKEWARERVYKEIRNVSTFDLKMALNEDGTFKKLKDMPDEVVASIKEISTNGEIKFIDKLKALEMLSRQLGLFVDKIEHTGKLSLEQLILEAGKPDQENK